MFALVKFIASDINFASLVKIFLFGFFAGNIISCIISGFYNQYFRSPNLFFVINIVIFLFSIFIYRYISSDTIFIYGVMIGLIGGGYNIMWAQYAATEFPTEVRSLACNMIFALGRTSSIFFGLIFASWISDEVSFRHNINIMAVCVAIIVLLIIFFYKKKTCFSKGLVSFMNKILFGITGSVSAYKAISLIRLFIKDGFECKAIITTGGQQFIKPELLVALGCNIYSDESLDMLSYEQSMSHINLPRWADKIIIVPASANTIAKLAHGLADDLLSQSLLANDDNTKVHVVPAMNVQMWQNKLTQSNILKLQDLGFNIINPSNGIQACGDVGGGRLAEPEELFELFQVSQDYANKKVVITIGATIEDIDGVRYLSNYSSGKMGLSLVKELLLRGAYVTILKAKVSISFDLSHQRLTILNTLSADSMNEAMLEHSESADIFIGCAAVADYKIKDKFANKIKKTDDTLTLEFTKNPDILANCKKAYPSIFAIGFAAESEKLIEYAKGKLEKKKLNMIVANSTNVFGKDSSAVTIISSDKTKKYNHRSKAEIAKEILDFAKERL